jgi:hypothetical protein
MKREGGINGRDDKSSGKDIRMADALAKINPTDPCHPTADIFLLPFLFFSGFAKKSKQSTGVDCCVGIRVWN